MSAGAIGNILKEARTKKAVTLEEVHAKIKIHPRVLQILEEGKFEKLPSPLFVKSFLKNYAEFLEINPEELLQSYEKEDKKNPEQILFIKPADPRQGRPLADRSFSVLVTLALFVLLGAGTVTIFKTKKIGFHHLKKISHETLADKTAAVRGESEPPKLSSDWLRHVELGNFPKINHKTPLSLKVHATESVWLRITCDKKVLFQSILKRGASETWTAQSAIEIWTGNSSNMALSVNNFALGPIGKGVIKKMIVSHEGVKVVSS